MFLQHPGSDRSVWEGKRPAEAWRAMRQAASAQNLVRRVADVAAVLDALEAVAGRGGASACRFYDLEQVGMAGHSFGALTTQWVSGQRSAKGKAVLLIRALMPR